MPETKNDDLMTAAEIGVAMERSGEGVRKAIRRLGIKAQVTTGRIKLYPGEATIARLEQDMRAPNTVPA